METLKLETNSYKPKQLLHRCAENDEFKDVVIIGVNQQGNLSLHHSIDSVFFLSACHSLLQMVIMDKLTQGMTQSSAPPK